ncbi:MAG TPA: DUF2721 domain-containing protein [Phycisphaerales bacterium]|nr:DUF2721 domain-containing protein [Phycisphaerales bacterium]
MAAGRLAVPPDGGVDPTRASTVAAPVSDIASVIQLAVAPVFLLAGIGAFINAFSGRLARIVDRSRRLEERRVSASETARLTAQHELALLGRRARWIYLGITLGVTSALTICLLIIVAFVEHFFQLNLATAIGILFVLAMLALVGALLAFLREVFLAIHALAIGGD